MLLPGRFGLLTPGRSSDVKVEIGSAFCVAAGDCGVGVYRPKFKELWIMVVMVEGGKGLAQYIQSWAKASLRDCTLMWDGSVETRKPSRVQFLCFPWCRDGGSGLLGVDILRWI